jgi:hypothetical protein
MESRPVLGPTQSAIKWVLGALTPGVKWQGVKLATHLHSVLRLRIVKLYLHSPINLPGIVLNYIIKYKDKFTFLFYLM